MSSLTPAGCVNSTTACILFRARFSLAGPTCAHGEPHLPAAEHRRLRHKQKVIKHEENSTISQ
jgi:hypothetical protein